MDLFQRRLTEVSCFLEVLFGEYERLDGVFPSRLVRRTFRSVPSDDIILHMCTELFISRSLTLPWRPARTRSTNTSLRPERNLCTSRSSRPAISPSRPVAARGPARRPRTCRSRPLCAHATDFVWRRYKLSIRARWRLSFSFFLTLQIAVLLDVLRFTDAVESVDGRRAIGTVRGRL